VANGEHSENADHPINAPRPHWRIRLVSYIKRKVHERRTKKEKESPADKAARVTASATRWMAIFTVVLAIVAILTLCVLIQGGADTKALVDAAKKQACAASKNAQAARDFADTASKINGNISDAVGKLDAQARATQQASRSAVKAMAAQLDAFKDAQSARLSIEDLQVSADGSQLSYMLINRGNSIALNISEGGRGGEFKGWSDPEAQIAKFNKEMTPPPRTGFNLAQGDHVSRTLTIPPKEDWWSYNAFFYVDIFGRQSEAHYCWVRYRRGAGRTNRTGMCPQWAIGGKQPQKTN